MNIFTSDSRKCRVYLLSLLGMFLFFWMTCRRGVSAADWTVLGDATEFGREYSLTKYGTRSYGGIRKNAPVDIRQGGVITFDYYVGDVVNQARNGFMVEFASSPIEIDKYGYYGYNDYYNDGTQFCGIEFTPGNICTLGSDRNNPRHIGIVSNYEGKTQHVTVNGSISEIADSLWHRVRIECGSQNIKVYQDGSLVLSAQTKLPENSYIGITAATSYWGYESHKIRNLSIQYKSSARIRLDANGGKCPVSSMYVLSKGSTKLPQATRSGYTFLGWYTAKTGGTKINPSVYTFKNGQTIYAHWRANKYTIVFQANGGSVSAAKKTVTYGNTCGTLPVPKRTKGSFLGWYTAKTGGTKYTSATKYRVAGNITLYAHWKMPKYTVKFAGNGGKASVSSKTVAYGSKIGSLPSASRSKYSFLGWYTKKSGGTKITASYKVTKNITFYAHWKKNATGGDGRETCSACGGKGYKTCMTCGGSGLYYWSGEGYKTCHGCGGTGKRTCTECNGKGYY